MNRSRTIVIAATLAAVGSMLLAPVAYATVTNPANNPQRIEVLGDDGNSYVDGQDTLPGYDDIACTFIPGAWFDFDNNRVYYADGQSIPWTEWGRIAGYDKWLAEKNAAAPAAPAPASNTSSSGSGSTSQKPTGDASVTDVAAVAGATTPSPKPSATPSVTPEATAPASPTPAAAELDAAAQTATPADASGAGRIILIALFVLGVVTFAVYEIVRRRGAGKSVA